LIVVSAYIYFRSFVPHVFFNTDVFFWLNLSKVTVSRTSFTYLQNTQHIKKYPLSQIPLSPLYNFIYNVYDYIIFRYIGTLFLLSHKTKLKYFACLLCKLKLKVYRYVLYCTIYRKVVIFPINTAEIVFVDQWKAYARQTTAFFSGAEVASRKQNFITDF